MLELVNGRYQGTLQDGRVLCVLPDVFEANRGLFPDTELYDPEEWISSVDGENCWIEPDVALYTIEVNGTQVYSDVNYHSADRHYERLKTQTSGEIVFKFDGGQIVRRPSLEDL